MGESTRRESVLNWGSLTNVFLASLPFIFHGKDTRNGFRSGFFFIRKEFTLMLYQFSIANHVLLINQHVGLLLDHL